MNESKVNFWILDSFEKMLKMTNMIKYIYFLVFFLFLSMLRFFGKKIKKVKKIGYNINNSIITLAINSAHPSELTWDPVSLAPGLIQV